jgi:predicted DNA-binding transcriptional regulator YafY
LAPDDALIAAAVRALRAGEHIAAQPTKSAREFPALERTTSAETLVALRTLVQRGGPVLLGYASGDGSTSERVVEPIRLDGGRLLGIDRHTDRVTHYSVARITGVAALTPVDNDILASEGRT